MIRKDYILRMVEEFGIFLAAIIGLKKEGKYDEALKRIEDIYSGMINIDPTAIKSIDTAELLDFLQKEQGYDKHYLKMIAELLFEEGQMYFSKGDPISGQNVLQKSKMLINYLMESDKTFSFDWYEKINIIDNLIN